MEKVGQKPCAGSLSQGRHKEPIPVGTRVQGAVLRKFGPGASLHSAISKPSFDSVASTGLESRCHIHSKQHSSARAGVGAQIPCHWVMRVDIWGWACKDGGLIL